MRIASTGQAVFAATLVAVGILGFVQGDFTAVWQPAQRTVPAAAVLGYLCAGVSVACGIGLLWPRISAMAARLLLAWLVGWFLLFKAPILLRAPAVAVSWESCAETVVLVAAAWTLYVALGEEWDRRQIAFASAERGLRIARALYGSSLVVFGLAHFAYLDLTAGLVPGWLPAHAAWAYGTGATYIAAGVAILFDVRARLAAVLAALQMGAFTVLVWVPVVLAGANAGQWGELVVSCALTAAGWVVADSYRGPAAERRAGR